VLSKDGPAIALDRVAHGPQLILVDGGFCIGPSVPVGDWPNSWHCNSLFSYELRPKRQ
jgi:hypothetical protein